jgi:hypothetical protein
MRWALLTKIVGSLGVIAASFVTTLWLLGPVDVPSVNASRRMEQAAPGPSTRLASVSISAITNQLGGNKATIPCSAQPPDSTDAKIGVVTCETASAVRFLMQKPKQSVANEVECQSSKALTTYPDGQLRRCWVEKATFSDSVGGKHACTGWAIWQRDGHYEGCTGSWN